MKNLPLIARLAGMAYLLIFVTGIFANFVVLEPLKAAGNPEGTFANFQESLLPLRWALFAFLVMVLLDALVSWFLFLLFENVNRPLSLLGAWFRLLNSLLFAAALVWLFLAYRIAENPTGPSAQPLFTTALGGFDITWLIGLIFFAIHLALLGYLVNRFGKFPLPVGWLLGAASLGYLADSLAALLWPGYIGSAQVFSMIVIIPGVVGELTLTLFLLFKNSRFISGK